jgi:hypothetical protein
MSSLDEVMNQIESDESLYLNRKIKTDRGLHNGLSVRRSQYIGVSKNNSNWQTLISIGKTKRYINTYTSEIEAAVSYDFYSVGIHGLRAKTNFSYSAKTLREMIISFKQSGGKFSPSDFVDQIIPSES